MYAAPHPFAPCAVQDAGDPGIFYVHSDAAPELIRSGDGIKAWIRPRAFAGAARRAALLMSPDAIVALHEAIDRSLARPLPAGEAGEAAFRAVFSEGGAPPAVADAMVRTRRLFRAETGYWPKKVLSRCSAPFTARDVFHIVGRAHFDSYEDPAERFVMIAVIVGAGPTLIRNPHGELPARDDPGMFAAYADDLRRRHGAIRVSPGSIVMKKANTRGSAEIFDRLPHVSGKVSHWPFLGKRVAFTVS